jgi:hypothetical protein
MLFVVSDENGDYADCLTFGHDTSYFADVCTNDAADW